MHASFSATIATWQSFFMLAGAASATLIGLLFVAVSLHIDLIGEAGAATILSLNASQGPVAKLGRERVPSQRRSRRRASSSPSV